MPHFHVSAVFNMKFSCSKLKLTNFDFRPVSQPLNVMTTATKIIIIFLKSQPRIAVMIFK